MIRYPVLCIKVGNIQVCLKGKISEKKEKEKVMLELHVQHDKNTYDVKRMHPSDRYIFKKQ
jgi:hypothetical protein